MVEIIIFWATIILAILGLSDLLHTLKVYITYPENIKSNYTLVVLNKDDAEQQIRYIAEKIQWYGQKYAKSIIAVYNDDIDINSLKEIVEQYNIILCSANELAILLG